MELLNHKYAVHGFYEDSDIFDPFQLPRELFVAFCILKHLLHLHFALWSICCICILYFDAFCILHFDAFVGFFILKHLLHLHFAFWSIVVFAFTFWCICCILHSDAFVAFCILMHLLLHFAFWCICCTLHFDAFVAFCILMHFLLLKNCTAQHCRNHEILKWVFIYSCAQCTETISPEKHHTDQDS